MKLKSTQRLEFVVMTMVIAMIVVVKFGFHELWKDEWQAWFVSRDMSLFETLQFLYYEGHPALWYLWLKPFTLIFTNDIIGLKLAHTLPLIFSIFLIVRLRGDLLTRVLLLLSYAFAFEYGVVCRGYIWVILLGLLIIHFIRQDKSMHSVVPILLFLLCQTEVQGVILAGAFMMYLLYEYSSTVKTLSWHIVGFLAGLVVFVLTVYPRQDASELSHAYSDGLTEASHWALTFQGTTVNALWPGVLPDTNVFGYSTLGLLIGALLLTGIMWLFRKERRLQVFFFSFWLATWVFHILLYGGGLRQWSMVAIALGFAFLLSERTERYLRIGALVLFLPAIFYSSKAFYRDIRMPFTNAKTTGSFIDEKVPENVPIVAINKFECAPVAGYADRTFFSLPDGETFTYFKWVEKVYLPSEDELQLFARFKGAGGLVIVSPFELDNERYPNLKEWKRFDRFNLKKENYILYLFNRQ